MVYKNTKKSLSLLRRQRFVKISASNPANVCGNYRAVNKIGILACQEGYAARTDGIAEDAFLCVHKAGIFCKANNSVFTCCIRCTCTAAHQAATRGNVDNVALPSLQHIIDILARCIKNSVEVDAHDLFPQGIFTFSDITISALCTQATVSRNTFYRIYKSKDEVLMDTLQTWLFCPIRNSDDFDAFPTFAP